MAFPNFVKNISLEQDQQMSLMQQQSHDQMGHHEFVRPVGNKLWCQEGGKLPETTPTFALENRQNS